MCPVWVHRFAVVTAGATLVLIFVGALVTSTGSGLAVPDWPLSFGQVFPPMVGGVLFEHGHRLVAAFVGLLTVTLMVLLTQWEPRVAGALVGPWCRSGRGAPGGPRWRDRLVAITPRRIGDPCVSGTGVSSLLS